MDWSGGALDFQLFMSYKFLVRLSFTLLLTDYLSPVKMSAASVNSQTQRPGQGRDCQAWNIGHLCGLCMQSAPDFDKPFSLSCDPY